MSFPCIAASDDNIVGQVFLGFAFFVMAMVALVHLRERIWPKQIGNRLRRFFGRQFAGLKAHEKGYPGYDLASLHRALDDFLQKECESFMTMGSVQPTCAVSDLLITDRAQNFAARRKPLKLMYERIPIDVDEDQSFATNVLYAVTGRPLPTGGDPEKFLVLLASSQRHRGEYEDPENRSAPPTELTIGIACKSEAFAKQFFKQLEARRKALSIYRGKVIDPVVNSGGIQTIAFRNISRVTETDLVLPDQVRDLLKGSIISFYNHQEILKSIGVELKRGILFHSQPGTGKTSISLYLAGLLPKFTVCFVSGKKLLYPRELCSMARYLQPSMLVFEDIDLIAQERDMNGLATVLGELMNQIDGCEPNDQVLFIMNTNSMERLEQAVRDRPGRVDQIIHIPLPDMRERGQLIRYFSRTVTVDDASVESLARTADNMTPAGLKEVVKRAVVMAIANADNGSPASDKITLRESDLLLAFHQVQSMRTKFRPDGLVDRPSIGF